MLLRAAVTLSTVLVFGLLHCHAQEKAGEAVPAPIAQPNAALKDPSSYAIGFNIGSDLAQSGFSEKDVESTEFLIGLLDALSKKEPRLLQPQFQEAMKSLQQRMQQKMIETAKRNLEKSNAYLETNKKRDGVQTTKTGLQYQVLKSGTGKQPTITDTVVCHYEGKLVDGTVFDSSIKRNQPASFPVSGVVPGWIEALQRMKVGDKWILTLPPNLGYGEQGQPQAGINPNEVLVFELELLDVKK